MSICFCRLQKICSFRICATYYTLSEVMGFPPGLAALRRRNPIDSIEKTASEEAVFSLPFGKKDKEKCGFLSCQKVQIRMIRVIKKTLYKELIFFKACYFLIIFSLFCFYPVPKMSMSSSQQTSFSKTDLTIGFTII